VSAVDLVCGDAAFVDLTFLGLDALPAPGEERHARELLRSPGGAATVAIGAARLGLDVALAFPLGADPDGDFVRGVLDHEGVRVNDRRVERTSVTAVMPHAGERAMATFDAAAALRPDDVAQFRPRAVVLSLPRLACAPDGAALYATIGDEGARQYAAGALPAELAAARALIVNAREARMLTGAEDPEAARPAWTSGPWSTPPGPATCSRPPTSGATWPAAHRCNACGGPAWPPRCRCASPPRWRARRPSSSSPRRAQTEGWRFRPIRRPKEEERFP
jgi:sugar/nucleoside kinase (ribokinase family)